MNKEQLNNVFDNMAPSMEQRKKMFAEVIKAKETPVTVPTSTVIPFRKYAVAAVAVLAISAGAIASYNVMNGDVSQKAESPIAAQSGGNVAMAEASVLAQNAEREYHTESENIPSITENADEFADVEMSESIAKVEDEQMQKKTESEDALAYAENKTDSELKTNEAVTANPNNKNERDESIKSESVVEPEIPQSAVTPEISSGAVAPEVYDDASVAEDYVIHNSVMEGESNAYYESANTSEKNKGTGGGGGGGGSASSGGSAGAVRKITYSEIRNHNKYSEVFPTSSPKGFSFGNAVEMSGRLTATYYNATGNTITVSVSSNAEAKVIGVDEISSQKDGYARFSLDCGDYYVTYASGSVSGAEMYDMATSAPYYK